MGKVFDRLVKESWKKWSPSGFYGVVRDGSIGSRLTLVAKHEPDVTVPQLLEFITPTPKLSLILRKNTVLALAARSPRGWLRKKGRSLLQRPDSKLLMVVPAWVAHGGGSYKHAASDVDLLFEVLTGSYLKKRESVSYPLMFAIVELLEAAPDAVWPRVAARLPDVEGVRYRWLASRISRLLPKAIKDARKTHSKSASKLEALHAAIQSRKRRRR